WIYFENLKCNESWVTPGELSTSTPRPTRYGRKTMLCVWWDQKGVIYYELLKPGETVNTQRYRQQMTDLDRVLREKRPEYQQRQHKVILLHDNAPGHKAKQILQHAATHRTLPHPVTTCLHRWDMHLLNARKWLDDWFASKSNSSFGEESTNCQKDRKNV
ncbi:Transposase, partial [Caligus rogercresseyi]